MRDIFFDEVETEDPEGYVRQFLKGKATIKSEVLAIRNRNAMIKDAEKTSEASFPIVKVLPHNTAVIKRIIFAIAAFDILINLAFHTNISFPPDPDSSIHICKWKESWKPL